MPRTGENIYKRKDGRWEGRYIEERIAGKARYRAVYARTYREVKRKLDEAKREAEKQNQEMKKPGKMADIGNQWLSEEALLLKKSSFNMRIFYAAIFSRNSEKMNCLKLQTNAS